MAPCTLLCGKVSQTDGCFEHTMKLPLPGPELREWPCRPLW